MGNVVTPGHLLDEYSADGVRYWASRARLGADTTFDESVLKVGKRLATKLFNASKFVTLQLERVGADSALPVLNDITSELDRALVHQLRQTAQQATDGFEKFDYAAALEATEKLFWSFCNDYLELVKRRSYSEEDSQERRSAAATLGFSLQTFTRLFAPFLPFVTEEIWSWRYAQLGSDSVHTAPWPEAAEFDLVQAPEHPDCYDAGAEVLGKIRMAKTEAKRNLRWRVDSLQVSGPAEAIDSLRPSLGDVLEAGNVNPEGVSLVESGEEGLAVVCRLENG